LQILRDKHGIVREDIFLQTKFTSLSGQDRSKPLPYDRSAPIREQVLASFETSLRNLRTTYIDSYVLHSPLDTIQHTLEAWRTVVALQDAGKVRRIGVSNTYDYHMLETLAAERKVQVVQNRWFQGNQWDKEVCAFCRHNEIMYQSFWTLSGSPALLQHPSLLALANQCERTPAQVLFRLAQTRGVVPLAGSTNEGRMRDGVEAEKIDLPDGSLRSELAQITGLSV